jgi:putative SOS response-associated peptidase YedK
MVGVTAIIGYRFPERWDLIPYWANDTKKLPLLHNARAETVAVKPLFKNSFSLPAAHHSRPLTVSGQAR